MPFHYCTGLFETIFGIRVKIPFKLGTPCLKSKMAGNGLEIYILLNKQSSCAFREINTFSYVGAILYGGSTSIYI